jgi:hypothetical protein
MVGEGLGDLFTWEDLSWRNFSWRKVIFHEGGAGFPSII